MHKARAAFLLLGSLALAATLPAPAQEVIPMPPVRAPLPSLGVTIELPPGMTIQDEEGPDDGHRGRNVVYKSAKNGRIETLTVYSERALEVKPLREFSEREAAMPLHRPFVRSEAHKLCNGTQDGWLVESPFSDGTGHVILVAAESNGLRAFAAYDWRGNDADSAATLPPSASYLKALDTLCIRGRAAGDVTFPRTLSDYIEQAYGFTLDVPDVLRVLTLPVDAAHDATVITATAAASGGYLMITLDVGAANGTDLHHYVAGLMSRSDSPNESGAFAACNGTQAGWHTATRAHALSIDEVMVVTKTRAASITIVHQDAATPAAFAVLKSFCVK